VVAVVAGAGLAGLAAPPASAQKVGYDQLYQQYLASARTASGPRYLWMADLTADPIARRVNDLVTVRVFESLTATGSADSNIGKNSDANAGFPGKAGEYLGKFLPGSSETKFTGTGGTSRTTELTASMTVRVVEVLATGDMVVEGVREIEINSDRTLVVLSGVIRSVDILPGNIVPSTRIGQLRIRSLSQGLIKDSLSPGWLIRILNKIF
jgi:flagellar L-ring protein precursor FlgH